MMVGIRLCKRRRMGLTVLLSLLFLFAYRLAWRVVDRFQALTDSVELLEEAVSNYKAELEMAEMRVEKAVEAVGILTGKRPKGRKATSPQVSFIITNSRVCGDKSRITYLMYVFSAAERRGRRDTLRQTWARRDLFRGHNTRVIFILGSTDDVSLQRSIIEEQSLYGDIVQINYVDSPRNTSYKTIGALSWINKYCLNAQYIVKAEDSVLINIFLFMELLVTDYSLIPDRFIICKFWDDVPITRADNASCVKWCLDAQDLPGETVYPRYCSGSFYLMLAPLIEVMLSEVPNGKVFWIDDVYATGILTQGVHPGTDWIQEGHRYEFDLDKFQRHYKTENPAELLLTRVHEEQMYMNVWKLIVKSTTPEQHALLRVKPYWV